MKNPKIHFFIFLGLIILGSSIPGKSMPPIMAFTWDKLLHVSEYAILGFWPIEPIIPNLKFRWFMALDLESFSAVLMKLGNP